jgi:hypothetical protein
MRPDKVNGNISVKPCMIPDILQAMFAFTAPKNFFLMPFNRHFPYVDGPFLARYFAVL